MAVILADGWGCGKAVLHWRGWTGFSRYGWWLILTPFFDGGARCLPEVMFSGGRCQPHGRGVTHGFLLTQGSADGARDGRSLHVPILSGIKGRGERVGRPACEQALAPLRPRRLGIDRTLVLAGAGMRFWILTGWPCTTLVITSGKTWLVFDVHDTIMEHGYGMGQRGGVTHAYSI